MKSNKIMQAIEYFGNNINNEIFQVNSIDDNRIQIDGYEYIIVDEKEREDIFHTYQEMLIDDLGLNAFTPEGKQYIIDNCLDTNELEDYRNTCNESYIDSIRYESPENDESEEIESRLEEEIKENGLNNEDEYLEMLNSSDTVTNWYIEKFGQDDLNEFILNCDLIDIEKVCEYISEVDGYAASLAIYDGEEIETESYFMYRVN